MHRRTPAGPPLTPAQRALCASEAQLPRALSRSFARRFKLPADDLEGHAGEALALAARDFNSEVTPHFGGYAYLRVKWALLSYCRTEALRADGMLRAVQAADDLEEPPGVEIEDWDAALADTHEAARGRAVEWVRGAGAAIIAAAAQRRDAPAPLPADEPRNVPADHALVAREELTALRGAVERAFADLDEDAARFAERYFHGGGTLERVAEELAVTERTLQRWHAALKTRLVRAFGG